VNRADDGEWGDVGSYQAFTGRIEDWPAWLDRLMDERGVTDIALYGDTRAYHAHAVRIAKARGVTTHCFEEGYLRPYWITYERGGANGHSRLMDMSVPEMAAAVAGETRAQEEAPPIWGAAWRHAFHGFRYHFDVIFRNRAYPNFAHHRPTSAWTELGFYAKRLGVLPLLIPQSHMRESRLLKSGKAYHLVLLQLSFDASMRSHSSYETVGAFIDDCIAAFAAGASADQHLVFKAHPFEDGRERLEWHARRTAKRFGLADRVVFIHRGKLGPLLDRARSAVTINSTAGQQALWRGLPLAVLGTAVYDKPEFTQAQDLVEFFKSPPPPDAESYRDYRRFLLLTSQLEGSFYTRKGRAMAVSQVVPKLLGDSDPYDEVLAQAAAREAVDAGRVALFPRSATSV
ncbi:MAG: capsule biosynthesis protein, partial [Pikeienuella sp.]